jgi:hypothetical protein
VNAIRTALVPLFFAAAGLVVVSGFAKLKRPAAAGRALAALRLPSGPWAVRAIGLVEVAIGTWCLAASGPAAAVSLGLLYGAFALFVVLLMRARGASCGCLGRESSPPSIAHLVLDVTAATSAAVVAFAPPPGVIPFAARLPLGGVPFLVGTALIAYLAYLLVAFLPQVFWAYGRSEGSPRAAGAQRFALVPGKGQ